MTEKDQTLAREDAIGEGQASRTALETQAGSAHTPGPWHYRPMRHDDWGWVRADDGGVLVARAIRPCTQEEEDQHRRVGTDPYEANARLIAAAPDLLAAARDLEAFVGVMAGHGPKAVIPESITTPLGVPVAIGQLMRDVRAAIAKAEGR